MGLFQLPSLKKEEKELSTMQSEYLEKWYPIDKKNISAVDTSSFKVNSQFDSTRALEISKNINVDNVDEAISLSGKYQADRALTAGTTITPLQKSNFDIGQRLQTSTTRFTDIETAKDIGTFAGSIALTAGIGVAIPA